LNFNGSLVWKYKWLIAAATIVAALMTFALYRPGTAQVWTGKAILTIGMAPTRTYMLQESGSLLAPIETPRNVIAQISDPLFKKRILGRTAFQPATAALSRELAAASLRAVALANERDIAVEISAGSGEDVRAVLRGLAAEIEKEHKEILNERLESVSAEMDDVKSRVALIEKSIEWNDRASGSVADDQIQWALTVTGLGVAAMATTTSTWIVLKDRIRRGTNLIKLSEPTVLHDEPDFYLLAPRSIGSLRASILAGLGVLAAMIVLTIVVGSRTRAPD
jgi:hypothetical protein